MLPAHVAMKFTTLVAGFSAIATKSTHCASAQSLFDSPEEYFGGTDHDIYTDWAIDKSSLYGRSAWFPSSSSPSKGVAVHWKIENNLLHLAVAARASGWLGFGFSENGGMEGSDVVYIESEDPTKLVDAHILDERFPVPDHCGSYELINSTIQEDFIIFETQRAIDTGDSQDRALVPDSHMDSLATLVIAAWGDGSIGIHGPDSRVRGQLRFFQANLEEIGPSFSQQMDMQAEGSFELRAQDYQISTTETQYVPFCLTRDELLQQGVPMDAEKLYIIGFEPLVDPDAVAHVHHFTVSAGPEDQLQCGDENPIQNIYGWAPGELPSSLPENVGLPFGDWENSDSLRMIVHYDNPAAIAGVSDSSGVRFYYSTNPREHDLGTAQYGDPLLNLYGDTVGSGYSSHTFDCPGSCSEAAFEGSPITVFRQFVHMHRTGASARMHVIRNEEIVHSSSVNFFKFDQQGNQAIQQDQFQIFPGDALRVVCEFNADATTVWGRASSDEMCIASVMYWPRKKILGGRFNFICPLGIPFPNCSADHKVVALDDPDSLGREFGSPPVSGQCSSTPLTSSSGSMGHSSFRVICFVGILIGLGAITMSLN